MCSSIVAESIEAAARTSDSSSDLVHPALKMSKSADPDFISFPHSKGSRKALQIRHPRPPILPLEGFTGTVSVISLADSGPSTS